MKALPRIFLVPVLIINLNESPAIKWPSASTVDHTILVQDRPAELRVSLDSYCFFNHPSLRTGTILQATANFSKRPGEHGRIEIKASKAVMADGRVVSFPERRWTVPGPRKGRSTYTIPKGTRLRPERLDI